MADGQPPAERRTEGGNPRKPDDGDGAPAGPAGRTPSDDADQSFEIIKPAVQLALSRAGVNVSPPQQEKVAHELAPLVFSFSGPLPPPGLLAQYEAAIPGCGRDIVDMAKSEQKHRHNW